MSRRLVGRWTLAVVATSLTVAAATAMQTARTPAQAQASGSTGLSALQLTRLQRLQGQFVYDSGISRAELWQSIRVATQGLDPTQARRDRAQLEQLLGPSGHVQFALEPASAGVVSMAVQEGRSTASAPMTGQARPLLPTGSRRETQALQLSQQLQGASLLRVVDGNGFHQERRFTLNTSGNSLTLEVQVSRPRLSSPLSSRAVYRRL